MQSKTAAVTVAPKRNFLQEWILLFCTAGLYSSIWFLLTARDLRRLTGSPDNLLGWLFVPLVAVVQPFTLPGYFDALRAAERQVNVRSWPKFLDYAWMTCMFAASLYFLISFVLNTDIRIDVIFYLYWIFLQVLLHGRFNRIRKRHPQEPVMPHIAGYNAVEWVVVIIFTPILTTVFAYLLYFNLNQSQ